MTSYTRHITSVPISNEIKAKLIKNGVESVNDLAHLAPTDLIKDFGLSKQQLAELNDTLHMFKASSAMPKPISVYDMLQQQQQQQQTPLSCKHITSMCREFDQILACQLSSKDI